MAFVTCLVCLRKAKDFQLGLLFPGRYFYPELCESRVLSQAACVALTYTLVTIGHFSTFPCIESIPKTPLLGMANKVDDVVSAIYREVLRVTRGLTTGVVHEPEGRSPKEAGIATDRSRVVGECMASLLGSTDCSGRRSWCDLQRRQSHPIFAHHIMRAGRSQKCAVR